MEQTKAKAKATTAECKIGKVTYIVRSAPSEKATDTLEKKVERLIKKGAEQIMSETPI